MSRWDALKPDGSEGLRQSLIIRKGGHRSNAAPIDRSKLKTNQRTNNNSTTKALSSQTRASQNWSSKIHCHPSSNKELKLCDVQKWIEGHSALTDENTKYERISELSVVITKSDISSTDESSIVAETLVESILLPFCEEFQPSLVEANPEPLTVLGQVLAALLHIVGDNALKTRFLAPLVEEVSNTGSEKQKPNHIRLRLFRVLQDLLQASMFPHLKKRDAYEQLQQRVTSCLIECLKSARAVEGTSKHALRSQLDVDPNPLQQFFLQASKQTNWTSVELSLTLLIALVQRHPETSRQIISFLLVVENHNPYQSRESQETLDITVTQRGRSCTCRNLVDDCSTCLCANSSPGTAFLRVLHGSSVFEAKDLSTSTECRCYLLAADLGVLILDNAATIFYQWLKPQVPQTNATFRDRIHVGFSTLMDVCRCNLRRIRSCGDCNRRCAADAALAGTLLRRLPFLNDEVLLAAGVLLAEELFNLFIELLGSRNHCDLPSAGRSSSLQIALSEQECHVADGLMKAIGGTETPQGILIEICLPVKKFLDTGRGRAFLEEIVSFTANSKEIKLQNVLRAILRTHPRPFLSDGRLWKLFLELSFGKCHTLISSQELPPPEGVQYLAVLLEGRRCNVYGNECKDLLLSSTQILENIVSPLKSCLVSETAASVKMAALSCFGFLQSQDWDAIVVSSHVEFADLFQFILDICGDEGKSNSKLKNVAFKALGDVCTNYFSSRSATTPTNLKENTLLCQAICKVLLNELGKQSSSSSMASYAVGNLARVLIDVDLVVVDQFTAERFGFLLLDLCNRGTMDNMNITESKLQTNSVRALGHIICLMFSKTHFCVNGRISSSQKLLLKLVLDLLNSHVRQTIRLAHREIGGSSKERSTVKKIGWGAGHALSSILPVVVTQVQIRREAEALDDCCRASVRRCLSTLMDCVSTLDCLNEKVGAVAMSALCAVDLSSSRLLLSGTIRDRQTSDGLIPPLGPIIVECMNWLFHRDDVAPDDSVGVLPLKIIRHVENLLLHLLSSCSVSDAESVLSWLSQLSDGEGRRRLRSLYGWLMQQQKPKGSSVERTQAMLCVQRAFDSFTLAIHKRPDLVAAIDDVQLEQQFSNQSTKLAVGPQSPLLQYNDVSRDQDDDEEL
ncbi:hypothetical protein ACA910_016059 [Epithemia clementina (nom. ined.)]